MTDKDDSRENHAPQGKVVKIPKKDLPEKITYDVDALSKFINFVFDADNLEADENILVWKSSGMVPGFPQSSPEALYHTLSRSKKPSKLYFGTSTTALDLDGAVRNRKALFKQFYVLVLDDIGEKIPLEKIPKAFDPTYIIESSPGNFQYGYVLDEPINVLAEAETLVQLVYDGGFSDAGGKMATKLVRLPDGVNGKIGDKRDFRVNLKYLNEDNLYSPAEILAALDIGVDWKDVIEDADKVMKQRASKSGGSASPWSPIKPELPSLGGVVDDVAEWLYSTDKVKQETPEWLTVTCPWADTHTDGNDWASYSPMGWGGPEWINRRSFHCFHEHCRSKHSADFLEFVNNAGGPDAPVSERAYYLTSRYVYDSYNYGIWDITKEKQPTFMKIEAFNYKHPYKVHTPGSKAPVAETSLFKLSKSRVDVEGLTYDPTTTAKIVTHHGQQLINTYTQPDWGDGEFELGDVMLFKHFIEYLIPDEKSREYYLDWLAAKCQDMAFRGPAILMIAESQGTGRSTLANMLAQLFGTENVERVPFKALSGGDNSVFNEWVVKPLIVTDETLALGDNENFYKVYERLKDIIDTTPQDVRVNPKTLKQRIQTTYASFMLFSNHDNAMKIPDNDRRFYVLRNAQQPESPEYFIRLNEWLDKKVWARSVWRWLRKREVDIGKLVAPPEHTQAKEDMIKASKQPIDIAVEAVLENWPSDMLTSAQVVDVLEVHSISIRLRLHDEKQSTLVSRVRTIMKKHTFGVEGLHAVGKKNAKTGKRNATSVRRLKSRGLVVPFSPDFFTYAITEEQTQTARDAVDVALSASDF